MGVTGGPIRNAVVRLVDHPASHTSTHLWRRAVLADSVGKISQVGPAPKVYLAFREQSRERFAQHLLAAEHNRAARSGVVFARTSQAILGSTGLRDARELQDVRSGEVVRSPAPLWNHLGSLLPEWLSW